MRRVAVEIPAREGRHLAEADVQRFYGKTLSVLVGDLSVAPARVRGAKSVDGYRAVDGYAEPVCERVELTVEVPDGAADLLEADPPTASLGGMEHLL